jgi:hypothetical protein
MPKGYSKPEHRIQLGGAPALSISGMKFFDAGREGRLNSP